MFEWNYECWLAFAKLKAALSFAAVLAFSKDEGQFYLDTDASLFSIGVRIEGACNSLC